MLLACSVYPQAPFKKNQEIAQIFSHKEEFTRPVQMFAQRARC